jgi:hypothetical protein
MLTGADFPIEQAIKSFATFGVEAAYLVPTETGLEKSIMDAHVGLRAFLWDRRLHDYVTQSQGQESKVILPITVVLPDRTEIRKLSLYRPTTKNGDPRVWLLSGKPDQWSMQRNVRPGNLLAIFTDAQGQLFLVNFSDPLLRSSMEQEGSPLRSILTAAGTDPVVEDLLARLRDISAEGFIETLRDGDTGIGFTLETLLGIEANSSKAPDFHGIELKAGRISAVGTQGNRANLFAQVPDWSASALKSSYAILQAHGYFDPKIGGKRLYVTVKNKPNAQGLYFEITEASRILEVLALRPDAFAPEKVAQWSLQFLEGRLKEKHRKTFWVKAMSERRTNGKEAFHYRFAEFTRDPLLANFAPLIELGTITMDFTIKTTPSGGSKDKGYLFKIHPSDLGLLFPPSQTFDLRPW